MPKTQRDWYDTPLYYDIIFDEDTDREASFLEAVYQRHAISVDHQAATRRILEPACGSGRLVEAMAARGHEVYGFDLNARMLAYSRQRLRRANLKATLWKDRLESFQCPGLAGQGFDLLHCLVSTFKYVLTEEGAISHLRLACEALRPGGIYVLGLHLTNYRTLAPDHERWVGSRRGVHVVCNTHTWPADPDSRTEALRTRLRITRAGETWTQETRWHFRTYNASELRALLGQVPELESVKCYDFTYNLDQSRRLDDSYADIVLVLRKRV